MTKHVTMSKFCENKHFSAFSYNLDGPTYVAEKKGKTQISEISFPENFSFFPSRQNSLSMDLIELESESKSKSTCQNPFPGNFSFFPSRQNSLTTTTLKSKTKSRCWCSEDTCQQKYLRQSRYPRIIEPSSKLTIGGFHKKVQIRIPNELQSHIGHGSCKHAYRALVTLITYIQLKCDFKVKTELYQTFRAPSREKYVHARRVIQGFGLDDEFYVSIWAPTFQSRFVAACGGIGRVQNSIRDFFASREPLVENHMREVEKYEVEKHSDLKSECLCMQKILSDHTITNDRKMSLCTGILYKAITNPKKI